MKFPRDVAKPALRAALAPGAHSRTVTDGLWKRFATSTLWSDEPLSTTTISKSFQVWLRHDSIASASQAAPFLHGMMTETRADMAGLVFVAYRPGVGMRQDLAS